MKILITGSAGFIGSALAEKLAERGHEVIGIDNLNSYYSPLLKTERLRRGGFRFASPEEIEKKKEYASDIHPSLTFIRSDITDREDMERLFAEKRFDCVINLAAQAGVRYSIENPFTYMKNNMEGFLVLLECARHYSPKHFIYASSSSVYGGNTKTPFSEDDNVDNPVSLYAATKKSNELMACVYSRLYGFPCTGLRLFTVYGPYGRPDMAPMLFSDAILKGEKIKVFNHGDMMRDFTYIDDITEGVAVIAERGPLKGKENVVYNIGRGHAENLLYFINLLEKEFGKDALKEMLPMQPGDVPLTFADTSRLQADYGYAPSVPLEEGVRRFAEWRKNMKS